MVAMTGSAPSRGRLLAPAVVLVALLTVAGLGGLAVLRTEGARVLPAEAPVPVLLVHGYGGSTAEFRVMAPRLVAAGLQVVPVVLPERGTGDLRTAARALARAARGTGADKVDVVGYSAGGVVARLWLREQGGAGRARHVVLLGSPNHGAGLAAAAQELNPGRCLVACTQLVPGSPLLDALNQGDETPAGPTWASVWSADDTVVTPPASASLAGAVNVRLQDVCPDAHVSHGELAADPLAVGLVIRALQGRLDQEPGERDCAGLRALGG